MRLRAQNGSVSDWGLARPWTGRVGRRASGRPAETSMRWAVTRQHATPLASMPPDSPHRPQKERTHVERLSTEGERAGEGEGEGRAEGVSTVKVGRLFYTSAFVRGITVSRIDARAHWTTPQSAFSRGPIRTRVRAVCPPNGILIS